MSFAHPLALLLLLLLIPVAVLYWLRFACRVWSSAQVRSGSRRWPKSRCVRRWQRWRTPVSLVLHMLTVVLLALAAAGPADSAAAADRAHSRQLGHDAGDRRSAVAV